MHEENAMILERLRAGFAKASFWKKVDALDTRELEAIVTQVQCYPADDEKFGKRLGRPMYCFNLHLKTPPREEATETGGTRSTFSDMHALIDPQRLDEKIIAALKPGAQVAIQGKPTEKGDKWSTCLVLDGGVFFYELSTLKLGPATNPVNPLDVMVEIYSFPLSNLSRTYPP
jgi:hypothetical protein